MTLALALAASVLAAPGAAAPEIAWTARFGSPGDDNAIEIARHRTGVYVIGRVIGAMPGLAGAGGHDVYVRRMDDAGREIWTRQFGTAGRETNMGMFVHDTGVYVAGGVGGALPGQSFAGPPFDAFVRKIDFDGHVLWTRQFGTGGYDTAHGIAVRGRGPRDVRVYVAGTIGLLTADAPGGVADAFLRAYDGAGALLWTRQLGSPGSDGAWDVAVHESGIYAAGNTSAALPGQAFAGGKTDVFVAKYDFDGNPAWVRQFGGPGDDSAIPGGIAVDDGGVYVSGFTDGALAGEASAGGSDAFVARFGLDGALRWTRQFGTSAYDDAHGVAAFGGAAYVVGNTYGALPGRVAQPHAGDGDAFVRRYSSDGREDWTLQTGTTGFEELYGVFADATGLYVVGFAGPAGDPPPGPNDVVVMKIRHPSGR